MAQQTETAGEAAERRMTAAAVQIDDYLEAADYSRVEIAGIAGAILSLSLELLPPDLRAAVMVAHEHASTSVQGSFATPLVALLREFVDAAAAPPELLTRAAAVLDAIEGRSS